MPRLRDELMANPKLVEIIQGESQRLSKALRLDIVDSKEVYRSMIWACIAVVMHIDGETDAT